MIYQSMLPLLVFILLNDNLYLVLLIHLVYINISIFQCYSIKFFYSFNVLAISEFLIAIMCRIVSNYYILDDFWLISFIIESNYVINCCLNYSNQCLFAVECIMRSEYDIIQSKQPMVSVYCL